MYTTSKPKTHQYKYNALANHTQGILNYHQVKLEDKNSLSNWIVIIDNTKYCDHT